MSARIIRIKAIPIIPKIKEKRTLRSVSISETIPQAKEKIPPTKPSVPPRSTPIKRKTNRSKKKIRRMAGIRIIPPMSAAEKPLNSWLPSVILKRFLGIVNLL